MNINFFDLPDGFCLDDLNAVYRKEISRFHPDKVRLKDKNVIWYNTEMSKIINKEYEKLKNQLVSLTHNKQD